MGVQHVGVRERAAHILPLLPVFDVVGQVLHVLGQTGHYSGKEVEGGADEVGQEADLGGSDVGGVSVHEEGNLHATLPLLIALFVELLEEEVGPFVTDGPGLGAV